MRPVLLIALLGTTLSAQTSDQAGSKTEPRARRSGTSATDALTENAPDRPNAMEAARAAARRTSEPPPAPETAPPAHPLPVPPPPAPVQAVPPGPPQKNLTGDEFR